MTASHWSGPIMAGPNKDAGDSSNPFNQGFAVLGQYASISFNNTLKSEVQINIPPGSQILDIVVDVETVFNSATSATFSAGITSGGTDYVSGVNVKASTGRIRPTFTAAQLAAMNGVGLTGTPAPIPGPVFLTVTSVGVPTAGFITIDVMYSQIV